MNENFKYSVYILEDNKDNEALKTEAQAKTLNLAEIIAKSISEAEINTTVCIYNNELKTTDNYFSNGKECY